MVFVCNTWFEKKNIQRAECYTDHQLLCVRVKVTGKGFHHKPAVQPKRFNVAKLTNSEDCVSFQEETATGPRLNSPMVAQQKRIGWQ